MNLLKFLLSYVKQHEILQTENRTNQVVRWLKIYTNQSANRDTSHRLDLPKKIIPMKEWFEIVKSHDFAFHPFKF